MQQETESCVLDEDPLEVSNEKSENKSSHVRAIHPSKDLNRYIVDKFHQPTAKSKAAPFEAIDLSIYKPSARCLAFSTSEDRLLLWIVAFQFRYYEITGNGTDYTVIWEEQDNPSSTSKCDKICIHLSMNTSTGEEKLVTITVFGTTGRILVQGKKYDEWSKFDFPVMLKIVNTLSDLQPLSSLSSVGDQQPLPSRFPYTTSSGDASYTNAVKNGHNTYNIPQSPQQQQNFPPQHYN
ncbi:unnamed protein product, partial [Porites lobata]